MDSKIRKAINLVQEMVAIDPAKERPTVRQLLILLKVRATAMMAEIVSGIREVAERMKYQEELQTASRVLFKEAEILSLFIDFSDEEAKNFERYLRSLDARKPDSLANFLAEKLNAEIRERYNLDNFSDPNLKTLVFKQALQNVDYEEDFQLAVKSPVSNQAVSDLIKDFYLGKGYQLSGNQNYAHFLGFMFRKEGNTLFVSATLADFLMVTVTSYDI